MRAVVLFVVTLFSGCGLISPEPPEPEKAPVRIPVYYQVGNGDTVSSVAKRFGVSESAVVRLNRLSAPYTLLAGSRIHVGYKSTTKKNPPAKIIPAGLKGSATNSVAGEARNVPPSKNGELLWPVRSGRIVSKFGPRDGGFHDGLDISAPEGTPVYASHSGTVVYSGDKLSGYGNLIVLRHSSGLTTVYAHNSTVKVSTGDRVKRGEKIAEVGDTGRASAPHLHFEVRTRDRKERYVAVDPMPLLSGESETKPRYRVNEGLTSIMTRLFQ